MIIRIKLYLQDGEYCIQSEDTEHVVTDKSEYLFNLESKTFRIEQNLNTGKGFKDSKVEFTLIDKDRTFDFMLDDTERAAIKGRKVIVYGYKEELNGTWALVEKFRWEGRLATPDKISSLAYKFLGTSLFSELDLCVPSHKTTAIEYPDAMEANFGKYIPLLYGNLHDNYGGVPAYNVDVNKYLLSDNDLIVDIGVAKNVFWRNTEIGKERWGMYIENGRTYIHYVPPTNGTDTLPAGDVEAIMVNVETQKTNPVLVLKDIIYRRLGDYDFFDGDAAIEADFTTRGIKFTGSIGDGDKIREVVTEFCDNFNLYSKITKENKLKFVTIGGVSQQSFTDIIIKEGSETGIKNDIINDVMFKFQYNFSEKRFVGAENYKHRKSMGLNKVFEDTKTYFFVEDKVVATQLVKEFIQQKKYDKKEITIKVDFDDMKDRLLGDVISVRSKYISGISAKICIMISLKFDLITEEVWITAVTYIQEIDYIINVMRNRNGGSIKLLGMNAVQDGQGMTIRIEPLTGFTIGFYWIDGVKQTATNEIVLTNITADHDILVVFHTLKFEIKASDDGNVTISPKGQVMLTAGGSQPFSVASGFSYFLWNGIKYYTNPLTVTGNFNHTIIAHGSITYSETITMTCIYDNAKGHLNAPYDYPSRLLKLGKRVWIFFFPNDGYKITLVKIDGVDKTYAATHDNGGSQADPAALYLGYLNKDTTVEVTFDAI